MTQSFRLRWRPELGFYDLRTSMLRGVEERGLLQAFRLDDESVNAQLTDWRWLSITPSGITVDVLDETSEMSETWAVIEEALAPFGGLHYTHARVSYQHVLELPLSFADAIALGYQHLFHDLGTDDVTLGDWALLTDVFVAGPPASAGMIEFGVVRPHEMPDRLGRLIGRPPGMPHIGQRPWEEVFFKDVSLFADSDLASPAEIGNETAFLDQACSFWNASRDQMTRLVDELRRKLMSDGRES